MFLSIELGCSFLFVILLFSDHWSCWYQGQRQGTSNGHWMNNWLVSWLNNIWIFLNFWLLVHWMLIPLFCVFLVKTAALFSYGWVDILMMFDSLPKKMKWNFWLERELLVQTKLKLFRMYFFFFLANHLVGYLLICKLTESQIMMYFMLFYLNNFVLLVYVIFYYRWVGWCPFPLLFYHKHLVVLNVGLWMFSYAIEIIFLYLFCSSSNIYNCSCS